MHSYSGLLNDLAGILRNQVTSITGPRTQINTTLRRVVNEYDYESMKRSTRTAYAIYNDIVRNPLPSDMKLEGLVDIQKNRNISRPSGQRYRKVSPNKFRTIYDFDTVAFEYIDGQQWLLSNLYTDRASALLHDMNSITENGTWAVADNGTNIVVNENNYISGDGSISVDLAPAGTILSIVNTTLATFDLTDITKIFGWVYLPTIENLSSATLRIGNDASNYYEDVITTPFNTDEFQVGWNFIGFDIGTLTGTVDLDDVDYIKLSLTFSSAPATLTGFLFDNILASVADPAEIIYYSELPWQGTDGIWKLDSTTNEDILNVTEAEYPVFLLEVAADLAPMVPMSEADIARINKNRNKAAKLYKQRYPSRRIKERMWWYRPTTDVSKRRRGGFPPK